MQASMHAVGESERDEPSDPAHSGAPSCPNPGDPGPPVLPTREGDPLDDPRLPQPLIEKPKRGV